MKTKDTTDTYEAAFYMTYGAVVKEVRLRDIPASRKMRKGYTREFVISLTEIPDWLVNCWNSGYTYGDLHEFARCRTKLKRLMKDYAATK